MTKHIPQLVSPKRKTMLLREITMTKVEEIVIGMSRRKYPRINGLLLIIFKIIGK